MTLLDRVTVGLGLLMSWAAILCGVAALMERRHDRPPLVVLAVFCALASAGLLMWGLP
jgi:hypothetical protein